MLDETPTVLPAEVAAKVADGWTLLDVRTDQEWAEARIDGSRHIPMDQLMGRMDEIDDQIICVCAVGARSARVAQFLNYQGQGSRQPRRRRSLPLSSGSCKSDRKTAGDGANSARGARGAQLQAAVH